MPGLVQVEQLSPQVVGVELFRPNSVLPLCHV